MATHGTIIGQIRQECKRRGWTAYRLAQEAGIGEPSARRILAGDSFRGTESLDKSLRALDMGVVKHMSRKK